MSMMDMIQRMDAEAQAQGGPQFVSSCSSCGPASGEIGGGAHPHWRPAPNAEGRLIQDPEVTLATEKGPLTWRLYYDTAYADQNRNKYGYGRRGSYPLFLDSDGSTVTVQHEDGTERIYRYNPDTTGYSVVGAQNGDSLVDTGTVWEETAGGTGFRYHFSREDHAHLLDRQTPQGEYLYTHYLSSRLRAVKTNIADDRRLTFIYPSFFTDRVQAIQDWGDRRYTLTYETPGYGSTDELTEVMGPTGCVTRYGYDPDGKHLLTYISDPEGYETTYTYDWANRVLTRSVAGAMDRYTYVQDGGTLHTGHTDPLGRTWTHLTTGGHPSGRIDPLGCCQTYTYANDLLVCQCDELGQMTTLAYDTKGYRCLEQDALGGCTTYTRDAYGNVVNMCGPLGFITTFTYGADSSVRQMDAKIDALGRRTTYGYLGNGMPEYVEDALGNRTTYGWVPWYGDSMGPPLMSVINALGQVRTFNCDLLGQRLNETDPLGNQCTYAYDLMSRPTRVENALGQATTTLYDSRGIVQAVIDSLGNRTSYLYNAQGSRTAVIDALGFRTTNVYNLANELIATVDALGNRTSYYYDLAARPLSRESALGERMTTVFDAAGRVIASVDALGNRTSISYDAVGWPVGMQDALANRTTMVHDLMGRPVATINPLGYRGTTVYNAASEVIARVDALGNRTSVSFDLLGRKIETLDARGFRTTTVYNALDPVATVDALGYRTTLGYDAARRQVAAQDALGYLTTTVYDGANRAIAAIDALGFATSQGFDAAGRPETRQDALGNVFTTVYDARGQAIAAVNAMGFATTTVFDAAARPIARVDAIGRRSTTVFDAAGRAIVGIDGGGFRTTTGYDAAGHRQSVQNGRGYVTTTSYDPVGRLLATQNARGDRTTTVFDAAGQSIASVDGSSHRTTTSYDPVGRRISRVDALGRTRTWVFDTIGEVVQTVDPKAQIATMSYNGRGERTETVYGDATRITLAYDARGQMVAARDSSGITTQTWDGRGLLATVAAPSHPNGAPLSYGYDARRLRTQMAMGTARHTYGFDALARNTAYTDPDSGRASWSYNGANEMTEQLNPNGTATTWTYESRGLTSGIRHRKSDGSELGVDLYGYDASANPLTKVTLGGRNTWGYDSLDQLTSEQHEVGLVSTWSYDAVGNRLSQDRTQGGVRTLTNYSVDAANELTQITEGTAVTTVTFDGNGNQIGEQSVAGRVTYLWNPRDLMTGYAQPDGKIATFTHRYDDLRASVDPGDGSAATKLVWDPRGTSGYRDVLAETAGDQSTPRQYWRGAHLVTYKEAGQKGVYQFDRLGNTERVTDAAQAVLASYRVSAWGEALLTTGSSAGQRFQFGGAWGAYRDALTEDEWMRARVMDPAVGRFLSADPLARRAGEYLYVGNAPLIHTDPAGLQAQGSQSQADPCLIERIRRGLLCALFGIGCDPFETNTRNFVKNLLDQLFKQSPDVGTAIKVISSFGTVYKCTTADGELRRAAERLAGDPQMAGACADFCLALQAFIKACLTGAKTPQGEVLVDTLSKEAERECYKKCTNL